MTATPRFCSEFIDEHEPELKPHDTAFVRRVYAKDLSVYERRLRQYGYAGRGKVLDAGCGFGQWSVALAQINGAVEACDLSPARVSFVSALARAAGLSNLHVSREDLTALPYADASFDAVFCYGVLFLTPWRRSLVELTRVLAPGGTLYVNANGFGWYKHLWFTQHNRSEGYDPRRRVASALANTIKYDAGEPTEPGMDILIDAHELDRTLRSAGFEDVVRADEGCLGATENDLETARSQAFFKGEYDGDLGVFELLARKRIRG